MFDDSNDASIKPSNGAYRIVDHTYDVVVVGAGAPVCAPLSAWARPT
jgi:hypothetical protein